MSFVVVEGLDGSGKSTQVALLKEYLKKESIPFKYLHFPRLEEGVYGKLIARFLRGEMGRIDQVDPYLVALLFAGDRGDAKEMICSWIKDGYFVLIDRYVYSNIAFQCAKINVVYEQTLLRDWILQFEFSHLGLPVPDINLFLDVPLKFIQEKLKASRFGPDRSYLKGKTDIHEDDLTFQKKVREIYLSLRGQVDNLKIIDCSSNNSIQSPSIIFEKLRKELPLKLK